MKKLQSKYIHENSGIEFEIKYKDNNEKSIYIYPNTAGKFGLEKAFVFQGSKSSTVKMIAEALLDISNFTENEI